MYWVLSAMAMATRCQAQKNWGISLATMSILW
uniref:Uncharacterized protein n=1 Tax=Siphoviridae sp. ct3o911 TaxID=2827560 RepID=A0A8S5LJV1_9CAUD|nr:MAG TPA: hypothetical protein [Siphoviridae sp. ct3o911]